MRAITLTTLLALLTAGSALAGDAVFIVNPSANVSALSRQDMEKVLLGKKTKWDSGIAIKLALLQTEVAEFVQDLTGKSPDQLTTLWKKLVFTGQGSMPKVFATEEELISYVATTPGGCGYASAGKGRGKVKEIPAK